jgi:hypothetical protein
MRKVLRPKKKPRKRLLRLRRRPDKRLLREYQRFANKQYTCWRCPDPIDHGDEYIGEVWVNTFPDAKIRFWVWRQHVTCPGKTFDEDAEEVHEQEEREREAEMAQRAKVA